MMELDTFDVLEINFILYGLIEDLKAQETPY